MVRFIIIVIISLLLLSAPGEGSAAEIPGTAYSRPNVSGGFDFYDSEGNKVGSSSRDKEGDYVYYNANGSLIGTLRFDAKTTKYKFYDGDNIKTGELSKDPYGGYRYKKMKDSKETSQQIGIRKDYKYANPYGGGLETLPLDVIRGEKTKTGSNTSGTGLSTSAEGTGLESSSPSLAISGKDALSTTPKKTALR